MESGYQLLHTDMLADISRCLDLDHPEKENVESCFWIAMNYWERLQAMCDSVRFRNDATEILFYRSVKPQFASYIEYFSCLSEGLMFEPPWIPLPEGLEGKISAIDWRRTWQHGINEYWTSEGRRGCRFYTKNQSFLDYCESDSKDQDENYFLARNRIAGEMMQRRSHNRDTDLFTIHEEILTTWRAYQLYSVYIKKKVNEPVGS
jgi:hypothetical protein